ncbi:MAG: nitroreductase family protein [Clostridia bacterium]|nr:nitroreductase family protein [Clostridia bacterium]
MVFNNLQELVKKRHSIRAFNQEPVTDELVTKILEVVQTAPTAGNLQAYEVVVVKDPEVRQKLARAALGQSFLATAPVVLGFVALPVTSGQRYGARGAQLYSIQDATIAATYAMLAATALGLATTWVGAFHEDEVRAALNAEANQVPVALLPLGYGAVEPQPTPRRPLDEIVREL